MPAIVRFLLRSKRAAPKSLSLTARAPGNPWHLVEAARFKRRITMRWSRQPALRDSSDDSATAAPVAAHRKAVSAPSKAWRFLQGESPCGVRINHPLLPSVATATAEVKNEQVS